MKNSLYEGLAEILSFLTNAFKIQMFKLLLLKIHQVDKIRLLDPFTLVLISEPSYLEAQDSSKNICLVQSVAFAPKFQVF